MSVNAQEGRDKGGKRQRREETKNKKGNEEKAGFYPIMETIMQQVTQWPISAPPCD